MSTDDETSDKNNGTTDKQKRLQEQKRTLERLHKMFINEMSNGKSSQDVIFKYIMEKPQVITAYLQAEMPKALVEQIDWNSLTYEPTNLGSPMVNEKRADILLSLQLKPTENMYVYFVFDKLLHYKNCLCQQSMVVCPSTNNRTCSIQLFRQHHAHQFMIENQRRETQHFPSLGSQDRIVTKGTTNDKHNALDPTVH